MLSVVDVDDISVVGLHVRNNRNEFKHYQSLPAAVELAPAARSRPTTAGSSSSSSSNRSSGKTEKEKKEM